MCCHYWLQVDGLLRLGLHTISKKKKNFINLARRPQELSASPSMQGRSIQPEYVPEHANIPTVCLAYYGSPKGQDSAALANVTVESFKSPSLAQP